MKFFKKDIELNTNLSIEEILKNLQEITRKYGSKLNENQMFEGKISEKEIKIYPIFENGPREQFRPEILISIINNGVINCILLKFRLSSNMKALFIFILILNLGLALFMMFFSNIISIPYTDKWWIIPIFLMITFFIFLSYFDYKVSKSISILKEALDAE